MPAEIISGKEVAKAIREELTVEVADLKEKHGVVPGLATVLVGEDPASQVYVRNKGKRAESCGFYSVQHSLDADTSQEAVLELIDELNNDDRIHGILVQLPLPDHLDEQTITQSISPAKDVDGFHFINIGKLTSARADYRVYVKVKQSGSKKVVKSIKFEMQESR